MPVDGVEAMLAGFKKMVAAADYAGQRVVLRSQTTFEAAAKKSYTQAHRRGTATPSRPGTPPAAVSGTLRRSWRSDTPTRVGLGWSGRTFPTTVYARIQELGGTTGRGGATVLPARPVLKPTLRAVRPALTRIHSEEFGKAIGR